MQSSVSKASVPQEAMSSSTQAHSYLPWSSPVLHPPDSLGSISSSFQAPSGQVSLSHQNVTPGLWCILIWSISRREKVLG